jgi:hypothetical protein
MDLRKMFGDRYLVTMEESWGAELPENRDELQAMADGWRYQEIKGKCGTVYPYSETQIAVVLPTRAARRLLRLMGPELTLLQHADDERCYRADVKHATALVRFIKPKSRRKLTPEYKAALAARLALYRSRRPRTSSINFSSAINEAPHLPEVGS